MSFYGSVYYQLIDTFYKMIVKNSGDQTFDKFQGDNIINTSNVKDSEIEESPAVGRKGVFSIDAGNYWLNFSKEEEEQVAAPYKIWHSKPHDDEETRKRLSGLDIIEYQGTYDGYGKETEFAGLDNNQLENGELLTLPYTYVDEAGHITVDSLENRSYRLPQPQNLFDEIGINNTGRAISEFNEGNDVIDAAATAQGPSTKLTFTPGNDWIKMSGEIENTTLNGKEVPCGNIYRVWHDEPREEVEERARISGWDYAPSKDSRDTDTLSSQYTITYKIENAGQANETKTEMLITDPNGKEVYNREAGTQEFIELREQDFLRIYPAYYDKAGHSFVVDKEEDPKGILYRLPKSAATELAELVGQPKDPIGSGIWFDNIPIPGESQNNSNSILNLFDYAEKNFENITDLRTKFGIIKSDKEWDIEQPLSVLVGNTDDLTAFQEAFAKDNDLSENLNILTAVADNRVELDAAEVYADGINARLGEPITTGVSAFKEIIDINNRIGSKEDTSDKDTVYGAIKAVDEKAVAAVEAERARAELAEKANADEIVRINNVLVDALENDREGLDSIKELATWIKEHGDEAADMAIAIDNLEDLIGEADPENSFADSTVFEAIESNKEEINNITIEIGSTDQPETIIARISTNESEISNIKSDISKMNNSIQTLDGIANGNAGDIIIINSTIGENTNLPEGETVISIISSLLERVETLESEIAVLKGEAQ